MSRILERDAHAFEVLHERYGGMIRRHVAHIVRDETVTEDTVQETFLRVWTHAWQWDGRGPFKAWLYRIATNQAFNQRRALNRRREQSLSSVHQGRDSEEADFVPEWLIDTSALGPDSNAGSGRPAGANPAARGAPV